MMMTQNYGNQNQEKYKTYPKCDRTHPTSQPAPRLITDGGMGVALPYLDVAINVPVDCKEQRDNDQS